MTLPWLTNPSAYLQINPTNDSAYRIEMTDFNDFWKSNPLAAALSAIEERAASELEHMLQTMKIQFRSATGTSELHRYLAVAYLDPDHYTLYRERIRKLVAPNEIPPDSVLLTADGIEVRCKSELSSGSTAMDDDYPPNFFYWPPPWLYFKPMDPNLS